MDYKTPKTAVRCSFATTGETMTEQSHSKSCDINNIMKKYQKTGLVDHVREFGAMYVDLPPQADFQHHMEVVTAVKTIFGDLPSSLRNRFSNDPGLFLAFCADPVNADELVELGLVEAPAVAAAAAAETTTVVEPPPTTEPAPSV